MAAQLTDGNDANGEADVDRRRVPRGRRRTVTPDGTLEQEIAAGGAFAEIVNETSPDVDAHLHRPHPQAVRLGGAGSRASPARPGRSCRPATTARTSARSTLTFDPDAGAVTAYTPQNVPRADRDAERRRSVADLPAGRPGRSTIVDAALAARRRDRQPAGRVGHRRHHDGLHRRHVHRTGAPTPAAPVTTARASRRWATWSPTRCSTRSRPADGAARDRRREPRRPARRAALRAGRRHHLRRGERGAAVREQPLDDDASPARSSRRCSSSSGRRNADGTVPSRPYLQLGLSEQRDVHVRRRPRRAGRASRRSPSTAQPIDPAATYRIGTFSFLATGGDNFRVFTDGTDADATRASSTATRWIAYLQANPGLSPDFARQAVQVPTVPTTADGRRDAGVPGRAARPDEPRLAAEHLARCATRRQSRSERRR